MVLQKWQQEVEVTKLPKMLQETRKIELKRKPGEFRDAAKYRLSHFVGNSAVVNDLTDVEYQKHAKERAEEKAVRRKEARKPLVDKVKELRETRNKLKVALKGAESGQRSRVRRLERINTKMKELQKQKETLEKEV